MKIDSNYTYFLFKTILTIHMKKTYFCKSCLLLSCNGCFLNAWCVTESLWCKVQKHTYEYHTREQVKADGGIVRVSKQTHTNTFCLNHLNFSATQWPTEALQHWTFTNTKRIKSTVDPLQINVRCLTQWAWFLYSLKPKIFQDMTSQIQNNDIKREIETAHEGMSNAMGHVGTSECFPWTPSAWHHSWILSKSNIQERVRVHSEKSL